MSTDMAPPRYSQLAPPEEVAELQRLVARMTAAGWVVGADGRSREPSDHERFLVAAACQRYGLDPVLGDVYLLGSRVYIAHAAIERRLAERGDIAVTARPATPEERAAHRCVDEEEMWIATAVQCGREPSVGYGYASTEDVGLTKRQGVGPIAAKRLVRNVAEKRARERAVRPLLGWGAHEPDDSPIDVGAVSATDARAVVAQLAARTAPALPAANVQAAPVTEVAPVAAAAPQAAPQAAPEAAPVDDREATLARWLDGPEGSAMPSWLREVWMDDPDTRAVVMGAAKGRHSPARVRTALADEFPLGAHWEMRAWIASTAANGEVARLTEAWSGVEEDVVEKRLDAVRKAKPAERLAVLRDLPRVQGE